MGLLATQVLEQFLDASALGPLELVSVSVEGPIGLHDSGRIDRRREPVVIMTVAAMQH